jgi:hypothetical protein
MFATKLSALAFVPLLLLPDSAPRPAASIAHPAAGRSWLQLQPLPPLPAGSAQPQLAVRSDGSVLVSWLETSGERHRFRFAALPQGSRQWDPAITIHEGEGFFANWADVPSIGVSPSGMLAAHWLQTSGPEKYAYDVKVRTSTDGGRTWSSPFSPHRDGTAAEHGFASFFPSPDGGLALAWLDGREMATASHSTGAADHGASGAMTLRAATISHGAAGAEMLIDGRVCDCCPTAAVRTGRGVVLAYRDRSPGEVRDIYVTRFENGRWTEGRPVARDNWQIAGCPVNGPSISSAGDSVAVAWFAAPTEGRVSVAFSRDGGETFGAPIRVDDGRPLGRVDVELLADGSALVGWIEQLDKGAAFRVRRVSADGKRLESATVAPLEASRASGYPRMARSGNQIVLAWVGNGRVEAAVAEVTAPGSTAALSPPARMAPPRPGESERR